MDVAPELTLIELAQQTGYSARLLPGPTQQGPHAHYTQEHCQRLQQIRRLQSEGFSLGALKTRLLGRTFDVQTSGAAWLVFSPHPAVRVEVQPRTWSVVQERQIGLALKAFLQTVTKSLAGSQSENDVPAVGMGNLESIKKLSLDPTPSETGETE